MSGAATKFDDLKTRIVSAIVVLLIAGFAIWAGGIIFLVAIAAAVALMIWELASMLAPGRDRISFILALIVALVVLGWHWAPAKLGLALIFAPALVAVALLKANRRVFVLYSVMIGVAGIGFYSLRADYGLVWIICLALVVIASDVMGYFAGRLIGGPKFWPKVSPKKTWSGTVAGWFGAIIVAFFFLNYTDNAAELIVISVALALAAQMGDIAESAIKRKAGVKDSSNLIPGHGGLLDRFDGMLGASVILIVIQQFIDFPQLPGVS